MKTVLVRYRIELGLFALAFVLRALFAWQWLGLPYFYAPQTDARIHELWALDILHGHLLRGQAFYQSPFYPYLLALLYKFFGPTNYAMLWLQVLVSSTIPVLLYPVAKKCFGGRSGLIAGILAAVYMPFIFHTVLLLKEIWVTAGLALFCRLALAAEDNPSDTLLFSCGAALGFTALSRGNVLLLAPLVPGFVFFKYRPGCKKLAVMALLFAAGLFLPILPVTAHNYIVSKDFVLLNYNAGFSFFFGNNGESNGATNYPLGIGSAPQLEEEQSSAYAMHAMGRQLKPSEISAFYMRRYISFVLNEPGKWLELSFRKTELFFNREDAPDDYSQAFITDNFSSLLKLRLLGFALLSVLGFFGLCLFFSENSGTVFLSLAGGIYTASVVITSISDRYRMPVAIFMLPFAAVVIDRLLFKNQLIATLKNKPWRTVCAVALTVFCLLPKLMDDNTITAQGWSQLVWVYSDLKQYDKATQSFSRALAMKSPVKPETFMKAGLAFEELGDIKSAAKTYQSGIAAYPGYAPACNNMAEFLLQNKRPALAIPYLTRALALQPDMQEAYDNMALAYQMLGKNNEAAKWKNTPHERN